MGKDPQSLIRVLITVHPDDKIEVIKGLHKFLIESGLKDEVQVRGFTLGQRHNGEYTIEEVR